jgi:hypothetical protein
METVGFEAQVLELADSVNGELTLAPALGVATVISAPDVPDCTVMFSKVSACTF